ncbi:MAG: hypothetical protein QM758_06280 [Armatimonas sp.]
MTASLLGHSTPENQLPPPDQLKTLLEELPASSPTWNPLIPLLLRIVDGERDRALAHEPGLHYTEAAEIHMLLDALTSPPAPQ